MGQLKERSEGHPRKISAYDYVRGGVIGVSILIAFWYIQTVASKLENGERVRFLAQIFIITVIVELTGFVIMRQPFFHRGNRKLQLSMGGIVGCCVLIQLLTLFLYFSPV